MARMSGGSWRGAWVAVACAAAAVSPGESRARPAAESVTVGAAWIHARFEFGRIAKTPLTAVPPEGVTLPAPRAEDGDAPVLRFGRILDRYWFCVDYTAPASLWIDLDGDGDLRDEAAIGINPAERKWQVERSVSFQLPGERGAGPLDVRLFQRFGEKPDHVYVAPLAHRAGTFQIRGRARPFLLTDGNGDLRFDHPESDRLFIDQDGDGVVSATGEQAELVPWGEPVRLGDHLFEVALGDPSAGSVTVMLTRQNAPREKRPWPGLKSRTGEVGRRAEVSHSQRSFEVLKAAYESGAPERGQRDLEEMGNLGSEEAGRYLLKVATSNVHWHARTSAIYALGYAEYVQFADELRAGFTLQPIRHIGTGIIRTLHRMGDPGRERFYIKLLKGCDDVPAVAEAAEHLAQVGTSSARNALGKFIKKHPNVDMRRVIYEGSRYLPNGPPIDALESVLRDAKNYEARGTALADLARIDPDRARKRGRAIADQGVVSDWTAPALVGVLGPNCEGEDIRRILELATHREKKARAQAVACLATLRGPRSAKALLPALSHADADVRGLAATILGSAPGPKVAESILKHLQSEADPKVVAALVVALGRQAGAKVLPALRRLAEAGAAEVRAVALGAIAERADREPAARAYLLTRLTADSAAVRLHALDAAAKSADPGLAVQVADSLTFKEWRVRLAAARALAQLRAKAAVEPLIACLEREKRRAVRRAVAHALFVTTGQHFYDLAKVWREWWTKSKASFVVPEEIPALPVHAGPARSASSFYGIPVDSDAVAFVIDRSGSMGASNREATKERHRLDTAVAQAKQAIAKLPDSAFAGVFMFDSELEAMSPELIPLTPKNRSVISRFLDRQKPSGGTNIFDPLAAAMRCAGVDTIFLLSDGQPGSGSHTERESILREIAALNRTRRVTVHCISIGGESLLLRELAESNHGVYASR